ncbi:MAG: histidine phosphatase family protein [Acidimicrobiia bacterium]
MPEIVLVRHAESTANVAQAWQGRGNSALSDEGRTQVEALAGRLVDHRFDAVVSSPLVRAVDTAGALVDAPRTDDRAVEIDLGSWEGMEFSAVMSTDAARLRAVFSGADEPFGGDGERLSDVAARIWDLVDELAARVGPNGRAAVVTHGGVIDAVMATVLPPVTRRAHRIVSNTSLTHLVGEPGKWRLARFNDSTHLDPIGSLARRQLEEGNAVLALIRHGRTKANDEGRCQGQSCWGLDQVGETQARLLADWYGPLRRVYTSPLERAMATAVAIAADSPTPVDGLMEIAMGHWEGLDMDEVARRWPELVRRIYEEGEDLPRGEQGETWKDLTDRIVATVAALEAEPGQITGVVSHGGAIRAYLGTLGGDDSAPRSGLHTPENTSFSHVALTDHGPMLCDYAVAPHLDGARVSP